MAGTGKRFDFHGEFSSKHEAVEKEREVNGFILEREREGKTHYYVLTERKQGKHPLAIFKRR